MSTKTFTKDCAKCSLMKVRESGESICHWGKSKKDKLLINPKGKKVIECKLKR